MDNIQELFKAYKVKIGIGAILLVLLGLLTLLGSKSSQQVPSFPQAVETTQAPELLSEEKVSSAPDRREERLFVDVKGAVVAEGVYELEPGNRVTDAIEKAGGFAEDADKKSVNLAQKLEDEAVIYVAKIGENLNPMGNTTDAETGASVGKVSLNKATVEELMTVSGIGQKRAQDIIAYREEQGKFKSLDELSNVSGIGAKTLEKLKSELTLD